MANRLCTAVGGCTLSHWLRPPARHGTLLLTVCVYVCLRECQCCYRCVLVHLCVGACARPTVQAARREGDPDGVDPRAQPVYPSPSAPFPWPSLYGPPLSMAQAYTLPQSSHTAPAYTGGGGAAMSVYGAGVYPLGPQYRDGGMARLASPLGPPAQYHSRQWQPVGSPRPATHTHVSLTHMYGATAVYAGTETEGGKRGSVGSAGQEAAKRHRPTAAGPGSASTMPYYPVYAPYPAPSSQG